MFATTRGVGCHPIWRRQAHSWDQVMHGHQEAEQTLAALIRLPDLPPRARELITNLASPSCGVMGARRHRWHGPADPATCGILRSGHEPPHGHHPR